jgi:hypothetical protein
MSGRDVWKLRLILLRFIREASPGQLFKVALYAANEMVVSERRER